MDEGEEIGRRSMRAYRRHQRLRMLDRALGSLMFSDFSDEARKYWASRKFNHLKGCSCWMCGNPRRYLGERTIQERRRLEALHRDGLGPAWERD